jgi:IS5 family transposase
MVRRRHAQLALSQVVLFGLVLPAPEALMEPWHLRDWRHDELEREVTGSIVYRRFCRIDAAKVPDAKTMIRLGQVVDGPTLRQLLHRLVTIAVAAGVTKGRKMRVDTTVVEAPIHHPTDSGLCEDVIRVLSRAMLRLVQAGVELGFKVRNVRRSVSRRMREIAPPDGVWDAGEGPGGRGRHRQ